MSLERDLFWKKYDMENESNVAFQLARYALGLNYELLPDEVVHEAKRSLLDSLGVAIGAYNNSPGRPVCEAAARELGGPEEATLIGSGMRTSTLNAALVNSFLIRYQDYNDVLVGSHVRGFHGGHGSDALGSILAVCEREKAGGQDYITSAVISYELSDRVSAGIGSRTGGSGVQESTPRRVNLLDARASLCMPPALGKVMGLTEDQIANAIGLCGHHSFCLGVIMREEPPMSKNIRFGWIAHDAILSCILAKNGFTGPVRIYESEAGLKGLSQAVNTGLAMDLDRGIDFNGWRILDTRYKYHRGCAGLQGQITATLAIVKENDLKPEDIESVRIKCTSMMAMARLLFKYPRVSEAADHSPYYTNAIAIKDRKLGPESYEPEKFNDPVVLDLIDRITVELDTSLYGEAGISEINTKDGRHFEKRVDNPHGFYDDPLSDKELEDKFREMAVKCMSEKQIQDIFDTIWNLERLDDIGDLMKMMIWKSQ
ncbi:MmgE/PrpD family protein [Chloroflexota bacterium]